jgi:hypothetical protein
MALEGTLRDFSLADIFQLIGLQRKTGVLTLRAPEDVVSISFLDGKVVGADSLNKRLEDRLGQVLLKTGAVTQAQLDHALKAQVETLERLGRVLMRHNVISREELKSALEQQILQIIFRVFRWQDGDYHFSQETSIDYDHELVSPMGTESILMEGARMLDEWPIIEKRIPDRELVFIPTGAARTVELATADELEEMSAMDLGGDVPPPSSGRVRVSSVEADVLRLVNGVNTVEDIVQKAGSTEFETCKALYSLLTRSLIRQASREELSRASRQPLARGAAVPSQAARLPWLAIVLVPLLAGSILLVRRNPLNPLLGPGPKLAPQIVSATSWTRMVGIWEALHARAELVGSYPPSLGALADERFLPFGVMQDPWGTPYRYVLRDQSLILAGSTPDGAPDANLLLAQHLPSDGEDASEERGVSLVKP